ncbi:hypothetical protein [Streptomyces sp. NRRL S-1824]|uniref:hypothetical protein n=1 Tax=Streptomyces sp. NRRL S-1824 TaxID=1463889 RepID=UPI000AFBF460|nr:hypothetical protein [Streptomyces sp. NRRL S-1824]
MIAVLGSKAPRTVDCKAPKPSSIVEEPATIAACRRDYESAAESRAAFARQQRTRR